MKLLIKITIAFCCTLNTMAQTVVFNRAHGFVDKPFSLTMSLSEGELATGQTIRYTLDGTVPTTKSPSYRSAIQIKHNTILRAAIIQADTVASEVTTATYLFANDVLSQGNSPEGYPDMWGPYSSIYGDAIADYEMDPEMTEDATLKDKIAAGLTAIPTLSIVTDKDNFFNHDYDEETGGIYIYTGAPVGNSEGRDWERPISMELFGGAQEHDLTVDCGVKIHGGHSRLAEKNPKHSLRIMFKSKFGPSKLKYRIFGEEGPKKFDQFILRCMFGNAWQHWDSGNRKRAQYTRDMWARNVQLLMGHPSSRGQYVHVYINGMYWGVYNIAERIDDYWCSSNFGGDKEDYDVIKVEEVGGQYVVPGDGTIDKWREMVNLAAKASNTPSSYARLLGLNTDGTPSEEYEPLLDVDNFIDYMLINYYGANSDWDHHNWLAYRNRVKGDEGFKFICWDSEIIFDDVKKNVLSTNNSGNPTCIFHYLMENRGFRQRFYDRVHKHLQTPGGLLTPEGAVEVWDSLYNVIKTPLYDEAARWGDYRRDVHQYTSMGELYTVAGRYTKERNRLKEEYFPARTDTLLSQFRAEGWYTDVEKPVVRINGKINEDIDTISYNDIITLRILSTTYFTIDGSEPYVWYSSTTGHKGVTASKYVAGTNLLSGYDWNNGNTITIRAISKGSPEWSVSISRTFYVKDIPTDVFAIHQPSVLREGIYDLSGRQLPNDADLPNGVYIINGKKVMIK